MARPRILQWLLFIYLLPPLPSELRVTGVSAIQFQYSASNGSSHQQFKLLRPTNPSYNGTKPAYGADGAVWLTPDPTTTQDLETDMETMNVGWFIFNQSVLFAQGDNTFPSFSTSFEFQIVCEPYPKPCADGIAFFISSQAAIPANSFGCFLGLTNNGNPLGCIPGPSNNDSTFFAVEFDTLQNPTVYDPSSSHIGIDVNSLISINSSNTDASESPLNLLHNNTFLAWVEYNASSFQIQVWMTNDTTSKERPPQTILETKYDLSTIFNEYNLYVGFSASTGSYYEGHALYAWSFSTQVDLATTSSPSTAPSTSSPTPTAVSPTASPSHCKHCTRKLLLPLLLSFSALALY